MPLIICIEVAEDDTITNSDTGPPATYRKVSNIRRTKSQNLNVSRLIL